MDINAKYNNKNLEDILAEALGKCPYLMRSSSDADSQMFLRYMPSDAYSLGAKDLIDIQRSSNPWGTLDEILQAIAFDFSYISHSPAPNLHELPLDNNAYEYIHENFFDEAEDYLLSHVDWVVKKDTLLEQRVHVDACAHSMISNSIVESTNVGSDFFANSISISCTLNLDMSVRDFIESIDSGGGANSIIKVASGTTCLLDTGENSCVSATLQAEIDIPCNSLTMTVCNDNDARNYLPIKGIDRQNNVQEGVLDAMDRNEFRRGDIVNFENRNWVITSVDPSEEPTPMVVMRDVNIETGKLLSPIKGGHLERFQDEMTLVQRYEPVADRYYYPDLALDGTANDLFQQACNWYIEDPTALATVQAILVREGREEDAMYVGFIQEAIEHDGESVNIGQIKKDVCDMGHSEDISVNDSMEVYISREGFDYSENNVTVSVTFFDENGNSGVNAANIELDEFYEMSSSDFNSLLGELRFYSEVEIDPSVDNDLKDVCIQAMEIADLTFDEIESYDGKLRFFDGYGNVMHFESWADVHQWLEEVVFDDPDLSDQVERVLHPEHFENETGSTNDSRSLMQRILDAGYPKEDIDHHESDLYVYVNDVTTHIINAWCEENGFDKNWHCPMFKDNITGKMMYDCHFQYEGWLQEREASIDHAVEFLKKLHAPTDPPKEKGGLVKNEHDR